MTEIPPVPSPRPEATLRDLADRIDDLAAVVSRQARTLGEMADDARARAARERAAADVPLLVDLAALHDDAAACAATARTRRERDAFAALAAGVERLLAGRGGALVTPAPGERFDPATMEAVEVVDTPDPSVDRTVQAVRRPGLRLVEAGRSVRPATVTVLRHRPT